MPMLLIVEDDGALANGLALALCADGTQLVRCATLTEARAQLAVCAPDLVLLDVNLPDGNGLSFLPEIKAAHPALPVLLLTANDTETDVVAGFAVGADDYVTKPFSLAILRARVAACLRHKAQTDAAASGAPAKKATEPAFVLGDYRFDFARMEFSHGGAFVELSKTEQRLLRALVEHAGQTLTRAALVDRVWTDGAEYVDENALSVTVKRLRDKLDAGAYLKTVYGLGYVWTV